MTSFDPNFYLAAVGVVVAGVVWAIRLEGRVNTNDKRVDATEQRFNDLKADLVYIRGRIDKALNGHG